MLLTGLKPGRAQLVRDVKKKERERKKKKRLEAGLVFWMKKTDRGRRESGRWNKQDKKGERERYKKRAGERE